MSTPSVRPEPDAGRHALKKIPQPFLLAALLLMAVGLLVLCSCAEEGEPIAEPDAYTHVYQAKERHILRALFHVFKDKDLGKATLREDRHEVTSDYIVQGQWRVRSLARVREIGPNEHEVTLSVITEKKTAAGWEMRRLLGKEQYQDLFNLIETQIYREMYKLD